MTNQPIEVLDLSEFDAWLEHQIETQGRESPGGFHFINSYRKNPYGWNLKYVKG